VALSSRSGLRFDYSFFVGFGYGNVGKVAGFASALLLGLTATAFYFGWIVPLELGTYRFVKKH
jgi:hypothetical protein